MNKKLNKISNLLEAVNVDRLGVNFGHDVEDDTFAKSQLPKDISDLISKLDLNSFGKARIYFNNSMREFYIILPHFTSLQNSDLVTLLKNPHFTGIVFNPDLEVMVLNFNIKKIPRFN